MHLHVVSCCNSYDILCKIYASNAMYADTNQINLQCGSSYKVLELHDSYWLQRSCGQGNIFTPVCHSVHRGVSPGSRHPLEHTPPRADTTPLEQTHPPGADTPPGVDTPQEQTPPRADPQSRHLPRSRYPQSRHPLPEQTPPPPRADPPGADTPQSRYPPEQTPPPSPPEQTLGAYGQPAASRHPTGMHYCLV